MSRSAKGFLLACGALLCLTALSGARPIFAENEESMVLRMGFLYQASVQDTVARYQPLFNYLEKHLPLKIEPIWYDNGYQLIMDLKNGTADLALADGTMYLYVSGKSQADQVAVMKVKGKFTRRAVIVVRNDSGLETLKELRGKRMALVGPLDELSSLWMRSELEGAGENMDTFFHSVVNSMSFEASILNTLLKEADAAAVEERAFMRIRDANPKVRERLKIIKTSPSFSNPVLISGKTVDASILKKVRSVLVTMNNSLEGNAVLASISSDGFYPQGDGLFVNDRALMKFFPLR